jgi:menaquinone-dependent protoporphyrinogen oxidase
LPCQPVGIRWRRIASGRQRLALAAAVAGWLDYPRYTRLDRQLIRCITKLTAGQADPKSCVELASWPAVDQIAARIAELRSAGA